MNDDRCARAKLSKLLCRQLSPEEVKIILCVLKAERRGKTLRAGRLGIAEDLVRRNWLARVADGTVTLGSKSIELLEAHP